MEENEFIISILKLANEYDFQDKLLWDHELNFSISCSDFFCWGCADEEPVTKNDLELLKQSLKDDSTTGDLLYCARKRKIRPQGAFYKIIASSKRHFFDACGPERKAGIGNPISGKDDGR